MKQRGFTLLEMIIGITLLGFILVLLYGGLRLGTRSWDAGEKVVEASSRQAVVTEFLRKQLGSIYPLRWKPDEGQQEVLAFAGEPRSLRFAGYMPARLGTGGVHLLALEEEKDGEVSALRLRWRLPDPELKDFEFPDEDNQARLIKDIESIEFAYFGAESQEAEPAWHDAWHNETQLPVLIRVRVKPREGEPWPDVLVDVKLGGEGGCRWDSFYKRCM